MGLKEALMFSVMHPVSLYRSPKNHSNWKSGGGKFVLLLDIISLFSDRMVLFDKKTLWKTRYRPYKSLKVPAYFFSI